MIRSEFIRQEIQELITSIVPFDKKEKEHIDFIQKWIASGAEIFRIAKPDLPKIHLVSYFILVDPYTNELLLVDHKKAGLWLPAGGHVEIDEHPRQTVCREIVEELGLEAPFLFEHPQFVTVAETVGNSPHIDVSLWYVLRGNRNDVLKFDKNEFHQIQWFSANAIPYERTDPHMQRFVEKVMKKATTLNTYEASVSEYTQKTSNLSFSDEVMKFIKRLPAQSKILDLGCGPGRDAKIFSSYCFDVTGIDFSSKMIETAKQHSPHSAFFVMDIENLTFPLESFDSVWTNNALLHISKKNIRRVLDKIHTILKPKGLFYLSVKEGHLDESFEKDSRYGGLEKYWSFYQKDELIDLLHRANFEIIEETVTRITSDYQTHPIIKIFARKTCPTSNSKI